MKRFLELVFSIKLTACLSLTAMVIICAVVEIIWGVPLITPWRIIQYVALAGISGVLQYVCFTGQVLKKPSYFVRTLLFFPCLLAVISLFAIVFDWFPTSQLLSWAIFFGIFLLIFLGLLAGFEVMFRITGRRYTDLLWEKQKRA